MIFGKFISWWMRLTHTPTGITVQTDSTCYRGMREARDKSMARLRSRIWAEQNIDKKAGSPSYNYDLDRLGVDGYNDELLDMRHDLRATHQKD